MLSSFQNIVTVPFCSLSFQFYWHHLDETLVSVYLFKLLHGHTFTVLLTDNSSSFLWAVLLSAYKCTCLQCRQNGWNHVTHFDVFTIEDLRPAGGQGQGHFLNHTGVSY